jgi:hypothetical protein
MNDFAYFPYTAHLNAPGGKNYYTPPTGNIGTYLANERTIVIDSIRAVMAPVIPYGWVFGVPIYWQWIVQPRLEVGGIEYSGQSNWEANGVNNPKIINMNINKEFNVSDVVTCKPFTSGEGWFRGNNAGAWADYGASPPNLTYIQIAYPTTHAVTGFIWGELTFDTNYSATHWYQETQTFTGSGYTHYFSSGVDVRWHYKYNHPVTN